MGGGAIAFVAAHLFDAVDGPGVGRPALAVAILAGALSAFGILQLLYTAARAAAARSATRKDENRP